MLRAADPSPASSPATDRLLPVLRGADPPVGDATAAVGAVIAVGVSDADVLARLAALARQLPELDGANREFALALADELLDELLRRRASSPAS